jgi:hypothetical protein
MSVIEYSLFFQLYYTLKEKLKDYLTILEKVSRDKLDVVVSRGAGPHFAMEF